LEGREEGLVGNGVTESGASNSVRIEPENLKQYYESIFNNNSEAFVYNAGFVKLRQLAFNYHLPKKWIERFSITDATFSLVGRNLLLLHSNVPNIDPESTYNNGNAQGLELYGVPPTRTIGFDLNVNF